MSSLSSILRQTLDQRRARNPAYSQNAFARDLGLTSGRLSEVLAGKQNLSLPQRQELIRILGLSAEASAAILGAPADAIEPWRKETPPLDDAEFKLFMQYSRWCPIMNSARLLRRIKARLTGAAEAFERDTYES